MSVGLIIFLLAFAVRFLNLLFQDLIFDRFAATALLMTSTIILAVGFGILLGLMAAMRLNTWKDAVITVFALNAVQNGSINAIFVVKRKLCHSLCWVSEGSPIRMA